jgi:integrase
MKPRGRHPKEALTDLKVRKATQPGRYADGNGLYLLIDGNGAKRWILRTVIKGNRTDLGLGSAALVPLADARDEARRLRRIARDGGDPLALKRKERRTVPTFKTAAESVHASHKDAWRNAKHGAQWIATLQAYGFPALGDRLVDAIDTAHVVEALSPIWLAKPETADRVAQRIGTVLDWCKAMGHRSTGLDREALRQALPKRGKKRARVQHHPALPYLELPDFLVKVRASDSALAVRLALEFLVLTGTRTNEVLGVRPEEIEGDRWTIPGDRMKAGTPHVVPLSPRCLELVKAARVLGGTYLFPGRKPGAPLSNMSLLMLMRRQKSTAVPHGFRSTFRDWAAERTDFPAEVVEAALAHTIPDAVVAAYKRTDFFDKRRELMDRWAQFAAGEKAEVVVLRRPA